MGNHSNRLKTIANLSMALLIFFGFDASGQDDNLAPPVSSQVTELAVSRRLADPTLVPTGSLSVPRAGHTATLLPNGQVLVVGGYVANWYALTKTAELYDPATGTWSATGSMSTERSDHTAILLTNDKVLVLGGRISLESHGTAPSAELYDPATGSWTAISSVPFPLAGAATLLRNGQVLVSGGVDGFDEASIKAELYDLETGSSNLTGSLLQGRYWHTATLLQNGKVLVSGGTQYDEFYPLASTELYDPTLGTWRVAGNLSEQRVFHSSTSLSNGKVLVAGGYRPNSSLSNADIYDPENNQWQRVANLNGARAQHTATLLRSGRVLVVGGYDSIRGRLQGSTELYDSATDRWETLANVTTSRRGHTATLLLNGKVLIAGGEFDEERLNTSSLFDSGDTEVGYVRFVPIVLSSAGAGGAFYSSELTLANRSAQPARLEFTYTATFGGGSGQATDTLQAGGQRVIPDAISYLRGIGIPIPESGSRGGTLRVHVSGLSSPDEFAIVTRTTTRVAGGRAGLAYPGVPLDALLHGPADLAGLRQDARDRSNVALQNAGQTADGDITLRLTVYSGDSATPFSEVLPDIVVAPGGFYQIDEILHSNGLSLSNGYVRIERVRGTAPYFAYAVINDQANSDGSFVPALLENSLVGRTALTLPVVVEANEFTTEVVATNWSSVRKTLRCNFVANAIGSPDSTATFTIELNPQQQLLFPNFVQRLRDSGTPDIGPKGPPFVGAMFAEVTSGDLSGIALAARTSAPGSAGGHYGVFYQAVPSGKASTTSVWVYGLQQTAETRSNLALVNTGETDDGFDAFRIDLFDGATGRLASAFQTTLDSKGWKQIGTILAQYAPGTTQGYARVTRIVGKNPFIAYAVLNDGGQPGERTGDGAFVASTP